MKVQQQQVLSKYNYNKDNPIESTGNYTVYNGTIKESNSPVTIKTLKYPHVQLNGYLKKMKQCKSQNVIKIYELVVQQQFLIMVTEPINYGNLKKALEKTKYLDEPDAIFVTKQILNGHVDLLRSELNWFGTEQDIEFAHEGQIKLSWNNGCSFNLVNPIPGIITKFSTRSSEEAINHILSFPISKTLEQLIRISKQNASQIAMNPQMKKKQKLPKRKGKNWIALRQVKNKNQYFDEYSYFSVHTEYGFTRVKIFDQGKISPNLLQFNKIKSSFTKIYDVFDQNNKTIILSDYSNDGNLQAYMTRLKTAGVKLKEQQIEYLVYSLLEPIKFVQESTLKAICMLHVRNIFLENGIPKIGQPVPLNQKILQSMTDRREVPDFYHTDFKNDPTLREQRFDTYSMGVLLYKLMYNDTPIFREPGSVQIPTAPSYNKRLKQSLQLFLNKSITIRQIEQQIQMNEQVRKLIEDNKQKLKKNKDNKKQQTVGIKDKHDHDSEEDHQNQHEGNESSSDDEQGNPKHEDQDEDEEVPGYYDHFIKKIRLRDPKRLDTQKRRAFVDQLQLSSFKNFRLWSKTVLILALYVFLFYYQYIQSSVLLIASQGLFTKIDVTISNVTVNVISTDKFQFEKVFNKTEKTLGELKNMNCLIQDVITPNKYSDFLKEDSEVWYGYVFGGLGAVILIFILKIAQIHLFDDINAWFKKQQGQGYFNLWNWVLINFHWLALISSHYFLFNFVFSPQIQPCIGHKNGNEWGSTNALFNNHGTFIAPYLVIFGLQVFIFIFYLTLIVKNEQMTTKYNKIVNTLTIFGSVLIVIWLILRFGIILNSFYYPTAINDKNKVIMDEINKHNYVLLFAILPEILFAIQIVVICMINWLYYTFVDKTQRLLNNQIALDVSLKDIV